MSNAVAGKLIQIIKSYPVLYDMSHSGYRSREVVEPIWEKIGTELNENWMELRKRWRNLRDTYVKLLRLLKTSENDEVFKAAALRKYYKWVWTKQMEFYRPYLTAGNKLGEDDLSIEAIDNPVVEETVKKKTEKRPHRDAALKTKNLREKIASSPPITSPSRKLKNSSTATPYTRSVHSMTLKNAQNSQPYTPAFDPTELDATDRLFLAHAQNIKQFSARRQAITKLKIAEVIMEQEILDQEQKDLASISQVSSKNVSKRRRRSEDDETMVPFETVCGYDSDEMDEDEIPFSVCKTENNEENPVEDDSVLKV